MRRVIFQGGLHAYNLPEAFETYEAEILRFAERSIRSSRMKQKISDTYAVPNLPPLAAIRISPQNRAADTLADSE